MSEDLARKFKLLDKVVSPDLEAHVKALSKRVKAVERSTKALCNEVSCVVTLMLDRDNLLLNMLKEYLDKER